MDTARLVNELNEDMALKHRALITYLLLAFSSPDAALAASLEGAAREAMHHFKWLGHFVAELGGQPNMKRAPLRSLGQALAHALRSDPAGEQEMVARFRVQAAAVGDHRARRLLERLVDDGEHRWQAVQALAAQADALAAPANGAAPVNAQKTIALLSENAGQQYGAILQYLYQSFVIPHGRVGQQIEDIAIQEMKHLGPLCESVAELGGQPQIEHPPVTQSPDPAQMMRKNIADERAAHAQYVEHAAAIMDEAISAMLLRFGRQESEHASIFTDLLGSLEKSAPSGGRTRLTVGSLKNKT